VILLAEASYTSKIKYNIDDLMSSLVACKTQAEQVDGVLANIGKRGNLNNFIKQFVAMDDAVKVLRKELDSVKAGLGDKLNNGWMKSFDEMVKKMSQISELSKIVFTGLNSVNLKDKGATKELSSYAEQLNTILKNVGIDKQIDLDLFNTKSVEDQFNALIQYASELNGKLNVAFSEIDLSKVGDNIKSAGDEVSDDIKDAGNKISEEVQRQIDELEKQKSTYQEALDIFNGKDKRVKTTKKNDITVLAGLVEDFKKAEQELAELERTGKSGKEEAFVRKIKAASQLKSTMDYVFEHGSDDATAYAANSREYDRAEEFLEEFRTKQNATLEKIKGEYKQKIADINLEIDNLKNIENPDDFVEKENGTSEEKKISLYDELNKRVKEYVSLLSGTDEGAQNEEKLMALVDEIKEVSQASKEAGTAIEQIFSDLDFGDITGAEALSKICELLNVEIPTAAQKSAKEVSGVSGELQELLNVASGQEVGYSKGSGDAKESMTLFGADKVVSSFSGKDFQVDTDAIVSQLVNNLKENIVMSLHNHPDGMSAFTPSDINSFTKLFYDQGTKINGIIADGVVKTIDFTGISKEMAIKIGESYSQNLKAATKEFPLMEYNDGEVGLIKGAEEKAAQAGISYEQLIAAFNEKVNQALDKAFTDNGLASTVKTYTMEQLPELSSYLAEIQKNGENSVAPIEKLKSLLATLNPSHTADWDKFKDIFSSFESGEIDSTNAWNQSVARIKEIEAQAAEAHQKTTEAINEETIAQEKLNQIQSGQPSTQSNQTDNQTAQLEKEKELMQEIAALKEKLNAIPTNSVDASELDAAQKQVQELEEEILRMEGALDSWKSGYYDIQNALDNSVPMSEVDNMTSNDVVDEYRAKIENLSSVIDELKTKLAEAKVQLGSATEAKQTGEPAATAPEVTSASGVQESFAAATEQKNQFVEANARVKESAEASAAAIEKEIEKAREASEAFASATKAKNDFANANQNVKDSADKTAESLGNEADFSNGTRKGITSRSSSSKSSNDSYKELDNYKTLIDANQKLSSAFRKIDTEVFVDKDSDLGQLKSRYETLSKEIQDLTKSEEAFGKVSEDDMQRLSAATKQLMSNFEQYAKVKKDSAKQSNTSYGADVVGQVETKHTGLINSVNSKGYANASGLTTQLQQYEQAYQRIITLQKELANIDITSDLGKQKAAEFDSAVESFNKYGKAIENIIKKSEEMKNKVGNITRAVSDGFDIGDEASRRSELEAFANSFDGLDKKSIQFADNYSKVTFTIKNGNGEVEKLTASFNQAGNAINASAKNMGKASSTLGSFFSNVKKKSGEILTYFTGANMVYKTVAQIKQGITYVREIDAALTELKKVTDETDETYKRFLQDASKTAGQIGSTVKDFTNATADFARLN
jgi:DNA repair exonuclease SbcCD ATPase subunit